ncbi:MAG: flagellar hook-basal body complex protein FliE [Steroidobacteraceae bacterium]
MSNMHIDGVLAQIRSLQAQTRMNAGGIGAPGAIQNPLAPDATPKTSFASVLKQGIDAVNQAQIKAGETATAFEKGTPGVELSQVMLEMQKASVSFRAVTEVRNRLVNVYQDIMNMPI